MRRLVACLAFTGHLGAPATFHEAERNVIPDEGALHHILVPSSHSTGAGSSPRVWDFEGTAFAKINLALRVDPQCDVSQPLLGLCSLMQKILWGDHVSIKRLQRHEAEELASYFQSTSDGDVLLMIDETNRDKMFETPVDFPFDDRNLIAKALKRAKQPGERYAVLTRKRVMPGSGLGGGTADAAFVVRSLGKTMSPAAALALGSDVAFLASDDNVAVVSGTGEKLTPLDDLDYVSPVYILVPDVHLGTAEVFFKARELISLGGTGWLPLDGAVDEMKKSAGAFRGFRPFNALEDCVGRERVHRLLEALRATVPGARCGMSGSGGSCFLLDADDAAVAALRETYSYPLLVIKTQFRRGNQSSPAYEYL